MKKYQSFLSENFQFLEVKCSIYLNRCVRNGFFVVFISTNDLNTCLQRISIFAKWQKISFIIHSLIEHTFLFSLRYLDLSENGLTGLPAVSLWTSTMIKELNFNRNKITTVGFTGTLFGIVNTLPVFLV